MNRFFIVLLASLVVVACSAQPTPTPTLAPSPTTLPATETPTPLPPTDTPSPTSLPPTATITPTPQPVTGTIKSTANVRQDAAANSKILGTLAKGDVVTLLGRTTDSQWLRINYPLKQTADAAWVIARLVQTSAAIDTLATLDTHGTPVALSTAIAGAPTPLPTISAGKTVTASGSALTPTIAKPTATGTQVALEGKAPGAIIFDTFANGQYEIARVRADGSGLETLITDASEPALSIKGILAYRKRSGEAGFVIAVRALGDKTGSTEKIVVNNTNAGYPTWSPDGNNIAYHLTPSGTLSGQVFWITAQPGMVPTQVGLGVRPAWRPGSSTILFDGCDGNGLNCYSLHTEDAFTPDVNNPTLVTKGTNAAWSPDSKSIAFQDVDASGNTNVFAANRDGTGRRQITKGTGHDGLPIWSADGQWLFYRSDQNGTSWAIYAIRIDGSGAYKVVDAPVNSSDWVYEKLAIAANY